jgi:signal transduction histidine kinase
LEIVALYTSPEALPTALAAGARHLAATVEGFALVYRVGTSDDEPDGWAGFTCAKDAQAASRHLAEFRHETERSEGAIVTQAPESPPRIWARAAGGLFGFGLRHDGELRGVALIGCPGPWPRMRKAEVDSILGQLGLVLDHYATRERDPEGEEEPTDELLRMSEQLFAQDIELIKKNERIDQVEQLHDDLIDKTSKELRVPVRSILERIISVLSTEHENLGEASRLALREALDDGNCVLRTLQVLGDLWRVKQDDVRIAAEDVNLHEVVEEAIFNVRDRLRPDVELVRRLPDSLPKVRTDVARLSQILFLILDNAVKFTHRGRVELELALEEGQLLVDVIDTGVGISAEDREQIFEEFFQVDTSREGRYSGAGLGLTLARALVERMGGAISVSSEIGRGSRFGFTLPVKPS